MICDEVHQLLVFSSPLSFLVYGNVLKHSSEKTKNNAPLNFSNLFLHLDSSTGAMTSIVPYMQLVETGFQIALSPAQINHPLEAVKGQLNKLLFRYHDKLAGIPLCYGEFLFPEGKKYGRFHADHPWVHIDITCNLLVFRPSVGDRIVGRVNKVSHDQLKLY